MIGMLRTLASLFLTASIISNSVLAGEWPFRHKARPDEPNTPEQIANSIDCVEDNILNDGTVVVKHPDVYGQSRMTLYRRDFEKQLYNAINNFNVILSARIARSDQLALASQTALQGALSTPSGGRRRGTTAPSTSHTSSTTVVPVASSHNDSSSSSSPGSGSGSSDGTGAGATGGAIVPNIFASGTITPSGPFTPFGGKPFQNVGGDPYQLGLEPTVYLDELKDYQDHLNEIRRANMGDDTADSAGYGMYLVRMPISIQPAERSLKGHGAVLTATLHHDFGPEFLAPTYRNLVVNDLVDQLSPIVYELIRSNVLKRINHRARTSVDVFDNYIKADLPSLTHLNGAELAEPSIRQHLYFVFGDNHTQHCAPGDKVSSNQTQGAGKTIVRANTDKTIAEARTDSIISAANTVTIAITRTNNQAYPISPENYDNVFINQNLCVLALFARDASTSVEPKASEIRAYLRRCLEAAYDVVSKSDTQAYYESAVGAMEVNLRNRDWKSIQRDYVNLAMNLPGDFKYKEFPNPQDPCIRQNAVLLDPMTILCHAIIVEAALLNTQLREDMTRVFRKKNLPCDGVESMSFHYRNPPPAIEEAFQTYVKHRWPIITFAIDPQVEQQNIDDASSIRRDLQLALSFAFSTGQIRFNQMIQYQRRLEEDAETIALNRTVTSFAHGNETFGFRFYPRYQNPPQEPSTVHSLYNLIVKGGPGRNYQTRNSKLEPGFRELNVVVLMPSFMHGVTMDVMGNFFRLVDPDEMQIPRARMIEQGRKVVELRRELAMVQSCGDYRAGDLRRLAVQIDQLEAMLPMQTIEINVPYENTLGGFQLFQEGTTSLVPQLDIYEGVESIDPDVDNDVLIFGKHFSIQETYVVVGGKYLMGQNLDVATAVQAAQKSMQGAGQSIQAAALTNQAKAADSNSSPPSGSSGPSGSNTSGTNTADSTVRKASANSGNAATLHAQAAQASMNAASNGIQAAQLSASAPSATVGGTEGEAQTPSSNMYVDVVSRQVLRLKIPAGVRPKTVKNEDHPTSQYVEVFVATPNGISNRLLIPYKKTEAEKSTQQTGYSALDSNVNIVFNVPTGVHKLDPGHFEPGRSSPSMRIQLNEASGIVPKYLNATMTFQPGGNGGGIGQTQPSDQDNNKDVSQSQSSNSFTVQVQHAGGGIYPITGESLAHGLCSLTSVQKLLNSNAGVGSVLTQTINLEPVFRSPDFDIIAKSASETVTVNIQINIVSAKDASPSQQIKTGGNASPPPVENHKAGSQGAFQRLPGVPQRLNNGQGSGASTLRESGSETDPLTDLPPLPDFNTEPAQPKSSPSRTYIGKRMAVPSTISRGRTNRPLP